MPLFYWEKDKVKPVSLTERAAFTETGKIRFFEFDFSVLSARSVQYIAFDLDRFTTISRGTV